jgi:hypothetical protein
MCGCDRESHMQTMEVIRPFGRSTTSLRMVDGAATEGHRSRALDDLVFRQDPRLMFGIEPANSGQALKWGKHISLAQNDLRLAKRKRTLLESNPPRNSQLETHRDDERGGGGLAAPCREKPCGGRLRRLLGVPQLYPACWPIAYSASGAQNVSRSKRALRFGQVIHTF